MINREVYKLTMSDMTARNYFQYRLDQDAFAVGKGMTLCSDGVLHSYRHPLLAAIFRHIHALYHTPRLFEAVALGKIKEPNQIKLGSKGLRLVKEVPLPTITHRHKMRVVVLLALETSKVKKFRSAMEGYLKRGTISNQTLKRLEIYMESRAKKRKMGEFKVEFHTIERLLHNYYMDENFADHIKDFLSDQPHFGKDFDLVGLLKKAIN